MSSGHWRSDEAKVPPMEPPRLVWLMAQPCTPGVGARAAQRIFVAIWVVLLVFEAGYLWHLGNGLNRLSDHDGEADTLRAAEAYAADGVAAHHGLARVLHGDRFPQEGSARDHMDDDGEVLARFRLGFPLSLGGRDRW